MSDRAFVDTNILIYAYDRDAGEKHDRAADVIRDLWRTGRGVLSTQVMQEFYVNVTAKMPAPLAAATARAILSRYLAWRVEAITPEQAIEASEVAERYRLSYWDGLIVTSAAHARCEHLLTEDLNHGQLIEGVRITNPFRD